MLFVSFFLFLLVSDLDAVFVCNSERWILPCGQWNGNTNGKRGFICWLVQIQVIFFSEISLNILQGWHPSFKLCARWRGEKLPYLQRNGMSSIDQNYPSLLRTILSPASSVTAGHIWWSSFCTSVLFKCISVYLYQVHSFLKMANLSSSNCFSLQRFLLLKLLKTEKCRLGFVCMSINHGGERILQLFLQLGFFLLTVQDTLPLTVNSVHVLWNIITHLLSNYSEMIEMLWEDR